MPFVHRKYIGSCRSFTTRVADIVSLHIYGTYALQFV